MAKNANLGFPKVLMVDNYDSFTYNLVEMLRALRVTEIEVVFNDQIPWSGLDDYNKILISPGPGMPEEAGSLLKLIENYKHSKSILGICLGHQAIAQVFGGRLVNISKPRHGQSVAINLMTNEPLFHGLPKTIDGGLYHSWAVDTGSLPNELKVTAQAQQQIMAIRHRQFDLNGIQFHPESYATAYGKQILKNWLKAP